MLAVSRSVKKGVDTIIDQMEDNGNYSFVGLSENVFDKKTQEDFYDLIKFL